MTQQDRDEFRELALPRLEHMYKLAYARLGNAEDAEDVVQETYLKAYKSFSTFQYKAQFSTWLTKILLNCIRDHFRKTQRAPQVVSLEES